MTEATSCSAATITLDGRRRTRIPFGAETLWTAPEIVLRCRDCGVKVDGVHHPGCAVEQCPACGEQLVCCDCAKGPLGPAKKRS